MNKTIHIAAHKQQIACAQEDRPIELNLGSKLNLSAEKYQT